MWLVVGLGNPGAKYAGNRHNIGFRVVDELVRRHALPAWASKLGGEATSGPVTTERGRQRAQLLKPMEFMNLSGFAVQRTAGFHKIDVDQIVVVHDDVDLPFATVRLTSGGGHGGHNGLRSMIDQLGDASFARLRMGVGRPVGQVDERSEETGGGNPTGSAGRAGGRAPRGIDTAGWVLSDFASTETDAVTAMIAAGCEDLECVLAHGIKPAMNQHNARPNLFPSS